MKIEVVSPPPYEEGRAGSVASGKSEISSFPFSDPRPACEEKARRALFLEAGGRRSSSPCALQCTFTRLQVVAQSMQGRCDLRAKKRQTGHFEDFETGHFEDWGWNSRMEGSSPSAMSSIIALQYVCLFVVALWFCT